VGRLFEIRQLEAPRRHLILRNRAVPQQGFRFTLEQRGEIRWQVGTGEGEAILSGSMLPETEFEFSWKKQTLRDGAEVDGSRIETVEDLVRLVWKMVSESVLVTVTWEAWELLGVLKRIEVPIERPGEYAVVLAVEWVKEGDRNQRRRPRPAADYNTTTTTFADSWATALRTIRRPLALAREAQQRAEDSITNVNDRIREMFKVRRQFRDSAVETINVAGRLAESFSAVASEASTLRGIANEPPHVGMPTDEPAARVVLESYRARLQRAAGGAIWQGAMERRRLLSEARPDVIGQHVALTDEDLRLLAYRVYGRIDAWQDVARFNELTGSTLPAGTLVLLPRLEAAGIA
jgi:hypothetical protein